MGKHTPIAGLPNAYLDDRMSSPSPNSPCNHAIQVRPRFHAIDSPGHHVFHQNRGPQKKVTDFCRKKNARVFVVFSGLLRKAHDPEAMSEASSRPMTVTSVPGYETIKIFWVVQKGEVGNRFIGLC